MYTVRYVPTGYGKRNQLDISLCIAGHLVLIETKAPGKWLTPTQINACVNAYKSGATIFFISSAQGLAAFKKWVGQNEQHWHAFH